jgi:hypothetical protein
LEHRDVGCPAAHGATGSSKQLVKTRATLKITAKNSTWSTEMLSRCSGGPNKITENNGAADANGRPIDQRRGNTDLIKNPEDIKRAVAVSRLIK